MYSHAEGQFCRVLLLHSDQELPRFHKAMKTTGWTGLRTPGRRFAAYAVRSRGPLFTEAAVPDARIGQNLFSLVNFLKMNMYDLRLCFFDTEFICRAPDH